MDSRQKILSLETTYDLLTSEEWTVVTGLFDPLTLTQAQRIAAAAAEGRKVAVIVLNARETLLSASARAALVAGLRSVDTVTVADLDQVRDALSFLNEDLTCDRQRSAEFVQFVLKRQRSAAVANGSPK